MNIDQHLAWLTSAVKASVESDVVNREKLVKNVSNCFLQVKKVLSSHENVNKQFEEFRIKATLLLLLCCQRVNQLSVVISSEDFISLTSTLPSLRESDFFAVIRSQKNYRFLTPFLSWLPPDIVKGFINEYFLYVDEVNPVTLAITAELLKCLFFSCHNTNSMSSINNPECLKCLTDFLSTKKISSDSQASVKFSGYYYLYLCECLYLMLNAYVGYQIKEPDINPCTETWTNLWRGKNQMKNHDSKENKMKTLNSIKGKIKDANSKEDEIMDPENKYKIKDPDIKEDKIKDPNIKEDEIKDSDNKEDQIKDPNICLCTEYLSTFCRSKEDEPNVHGNLSFSEAPIKALLKLCHDNIEAVSVDVWMVWSETILPANVQVHRLSIHEHVRNQPRSIQSVIRNLAFDILQVLDLSFNPNEALSQHNNACTFMSNQQTGPCCKQNYAFLRLNSTLSSTKLSDLMNFLRQVALDPDHDPDQDLDVDQLVEESNRLLQEKSQGGRLSKLLGMLVEKDEIFICKDAVGCLQVGRGVAEPSTKITLLKRFIPLAKAGSPLCPVWLDVILELAEDLACREVLSVVEECLSAGLDECLQSPHFPQHMTAVFNQMAGEESHELKSVERLAWLCLQSGKCVVEQAVTLAVTLTGLVPIVVQSLSAIATVCTTVLPHGTSLLTASLLKHQKRQMNEKETREFIALVKGLLRSPGKVLSVPEVVNTLVNPFLYLRDGMDAKNLLLPLELLKEAVNYDMDELNQAGAALPSLMVTLAQIADVAVYIQGQGTEHLLTLRSTATQILGTLATALLAKKDNFKTEISLLKHAMVEKYSVHPRTLHALSAIVEAKQSKDRDTVDQALWEVMNGAECCSKEMRTSLFEEKGLSEKLKSVSRSEWIAVLIQLLPHCNEREWMAAIFLTHCVLKSHSSVFPTLEVLQEVLYICSFLVLPSLSLQEPESWRTEKKKGSSSREETIKENRADRDKENEKRKEMDDVKSRRGEEEEEEDEGIEGWLNEKEQYKTHASLSVPIPVQHCFQCFASAAMMYVESAVRHLSNGQKFVYLCSVFHWWCCRISSYQCDSKLPTLFLARLTGALEDMVSSERVKVVAINNSKVGVAGKTDLRIKAAMTNSKAGNSDLGMKIPLKVTASMNSVAGNTGSEVGSIDSKAESTDCKVENRDSEAESTDSKATGTNLVMKAVVCDPRCTSGMTEDAGMCMGSRDKNKTVVTHDLSGVKRKDEVNESEVKNGKKASYDSLDRDKWSVDVCGLVSEVLANKEVTTVSSFDSEGLMKKTRSDKDCQYNAENKPSTNTTQRINTLNQKDSSVEICSQEIKEEDFKREVEQLMWCLVKYVPPTHLVSSIANRLMKLYEL